MDQGAPNQRGHHYLAKNTFQGQEGQKRRVYLTPSEDEKNDRFTEIEKLKERLELADGLTRKLAFLSEDLLKVNVTFATVLKKALLHLS